MSVSQEAEKQEVKNSLLGRLFGTRDAAKAESNVTDRAAIAAHAESMLVNLRNMRTLKVNDISVPRADIVAVSIDADVTEVLRVFQENTLSRLPVYLETLDQPKGLVHFKDFALQNGFGKMSQTFSMAELLRPLLYVPPSMPIGVLLNKMQTTRTHMALVIDEYGGVDGLVTIEDLLEQIVGDIADEHDEEEDNLLLREKDGVFVVSARMDLDDFAEETGVELGLSNKDEEIDTIGGLIFRLSGRVPERGEIVIHENGHEFDVLDADARRIKRARVRLHSANLGVTPPQAAE